MKIALVCAMECEIAELAQYLEGAKSREFFGLGLTEGELCGHRVAVVLSGIGKAAAAAATQAVICGLSPDILINIGLAGSCARLPIGGAVVAERLLYHDFDLEILRADRQLREGFFCDDRLRGLASAALGQLNIECMDGVVASGDQFICDSAVKDNIVARTHCACVDMEGAAIGQICARCELPFVSVKIMSDGADESADRDFEFSAAAYGERSAAIIRRMVSQL